MLSRRCSVEVDKLHYDHLRVTRLNNMRVIFRLRSAQGSAFRVYRDSQFPFHYKTIIMRPHRQKVNEKKKKKKRRPRGPFVGIKHRHWHSDLQYCFVSWIWQGENKTAWLARAHCDSVGMSIDPVFASLCSVRTCSVRITSTHTTPIVSDQKTLLSFTAELVAYCVLCVCVERARVNCISQVTNLCAFTKISVFT